MRGLLGMVSWLLGDGKQLLGDLGLLDAVLGVPIAQNHAVIGTLGVASITKEAMRSASSMLGSEEMPTKDMAGFTLRNVKYSVGLRPHVMTELLMPRSARRSISCST